MKPLWSVLLLAVAGSRAGDAATTTVTPSTVVTTTVSLPTAPPPSSSSNFEPLKSSCHLYCFITPEKNERVNFTLYANLTACTHFVYGLGEMTSGYQYKGPSLHDEPTHSYPGNLHFLRKLKRSNPNASILLGVHLNQRDSLISSPTTRVKLASSLILAARDITVHGLFLRVDRPFIDNSRFEYFFKDLHSLNNSLPVTMAIPLPLISSSITHILGAAPYVDAVYLMSTPSMTKLSQVDPLLPSNAAPPEQTISYNANVLVDKGIPMKKIIVGLTAGSVVYKNYLVDSLRGEADGELDSLQETCGTIGEKILDSATATEMIKNTHTHTIIFSNAPIEASLGRKARWLTSAGFGGLGLQSLQQDDPKGECGLEGGEFPALRMAAENMMCYEDIGHARSCTRLCYINSDRQLHNLQPGSCSHIVIEATLSMLGEVKLTKEAGITARWIRNWHVARKPQLLISLGPRATSDIWRIVTSLQYYRQAVLMTEWKGSGVEISWTLGQMDLPSDATNLEALLVEMRAEIGFKSTLNLAVSHMSTYSNRYNSMTKLNATVDHVVLHSHRFHSTLKPFTGHHSPLFSKSDILPETQNTVEYMVSVWHRALKMKRSQIIVGITAEPLSMNLLGNDRSDPSPFGMQAKPSVSMPMMRSDDGDRKAVNGKKVCELEHDESSRVEFIEALGVPFLVNGVQFVAYENERSAAIKSTWVSLNQLGGIALFDVQLDNPEGECPKQPFPLLTAIARTQVCETCVREDEVLPCNSPFTTSCSYRLPTHNELRPMPASRIPFESCTQVVIEEVLLVKDGSVRFRDDTAKKAMEKLTSEQPRVGMKRTIVSVRCDMEYMHFKELLRGNGPRAVTSLLSFIANYSLSGVELACDHLIEDEEDKGAFTSLLSGLRIALVDSTPFKKCHHTLSVRLPIYSRNLTEKYDVKMLNTVQHVVLEPFNDPPRENVTHLNSPLFASNKHNDDIETIVGAWRAAGLEKGKILIQIPAYATLQDFSSNVTQVGVAASNPRVIGQAQVCKLLEPKGANATKGLDQTMIWDRIATYAITEKREWMSMQDQNTIAYKTFYALREGLGGIGLLSLNEDDWEGRCGKGEFPLLTAARARCLESGV